jgi:tryptophan-rich sensory protein
MTIKWPIVFLPIVASNVVQLAFKPEYTDTPTVIQPPGWIFGLIWTVIYLLYGVFLYRLTTMRHPMMNYIVALSAVNLILNLMWSPLVFVYKQRVAGLYIIHALIATLIALIIMLDDKSSKLLLLPYLSWLIVASQLQLFSVINI